MLDFKAVEQALATALAPFGLVGPHITEGFVEHSGRYARRPTLTFEVRAQLGAAPPPPPEPEPAPPEYVPVARHVDGRVVHVEVLPGGKVRPWIRPLDG